MCPFRSRHAEIFQSISTLFTPNDTDVGKKRTYKKVTRSGTFHFSSSTPRGTTRFGVMPRHSRISEWQLDLDPLTTAGLGLPRELFNKYQFVSNCRGQHLLEDGLNYGHFLALAPATCCSLSHQPARLVPACNPCDSSSSPRRIPWPRP